MARTLQEILNDEDPKVVEQAKAMATEMLLDINLAELKNRAELTQKQVADAMGGKTAHGSGYGKSWAGY